MSTVRRWAGLALAAGLFALSACSEDPMGPAPSVAPEASEQAVLIHIPTPKDSADDLALADIEDPVIAVLESTGAGQWDGNEIGPDGAVIYLYGPDADRLLVVIKPRPRERPAPTRKLRREAVRPAGLTGITYTAEVVEATAKLMRHAARAAKAPPRLPW